jgi:asparagine synthase (glutamine-hydrolysing)
MEAARCGPESFGPELAAIFPNRDLERLMPSATDNSLPDALGAARRRSDSPRLFDLDGYLPGDLMRKADTASMSVPLEVRSPFLDPDLAQAAIETPESLLMPHGQRKGLLRAVARKYLPPEIVDRPKQGFAIPIGEWFRSDYGGMRQLLLDHMNGPEPFGPDHLGINGMINMAYVRQMLREHDAAGVRSIWPWKGRDHSQRLYMMLVLSMWAKWLGGL